MWNSWPANLCSASVSLSTFSRSQRQTCLNCRKRNREQFILRYRNGRIIATYLLIYFWLYFLSVYVWVMFYFRCFFLSLLTHRVRDYYFVCAIGGQHDGHLPFWLPGFVKFIMLKLYVFVCIAEINILLLTYWLTSDTSDDGGCCSASSVRDRATLSDGEPRSHGDAGLRRRRWTWPWDIVA